MSEDLQCTAIFPGHHGLRCCLASCLSALSGMNTNALRLTAPLFCPAKCKLTPAVKTACVTAAQHYCNLLFPNIFTCSDCPWSRSSHVPQADVRGAASHLSFDPWPHRDRCYRYRWGFLQVLRKRHHCAHQDWQVRLLEEVHPLNLLCEALTHNILHGTHCKQRNWCIIISL